jgi:hypothetical protein
MAETSRISYLGRTFNTWGCGKGPALTSDDQGTPAESGEVLREFLLAAEQGLALTHARLGVEARRRRSVHSMRSSRGTNRKFIT